MKNKLLLSFMVVALLGVPCTKAYGNEPIESIISKQELTYKGQVFDVENIVKNSELNPIDALFKYRDEIGYKGMNKVKYKAELSYGEPYDVVLARDEVENALVNDQDISSAITNSRHIWEVPVLNKNLRLSLHLL